VTLRFRPVLSGTYVDPIFSAFNGHGWLFAICVLGIYWGLPLAGLIGSAALSGTNGQGSPIPLYLADPTHTAFSTVLTVCAFFVFHFVRRFHLQLSRASRAGLAGRDTVILGQYERYRLLPFGAYVLFVPATLAVATFVVVTERIYGPDHSQWWGHIRFGCGGIIFSWCVSGIVFLAVHFFMAFVCVGMFMRTFIKRNLRIDPLHHDGLAGMVPFGVILMAFWRITVGTWVGMFVLFYSDYLDLTQNWFIWLLGAFAVTASPVASVAPLIMFLTEVHQQKAAIQQRALRQISRDRRSRNDRETNPDNIHHFVQVRDSIDRIRVMPINGLRLSGIFLFNGLQVLIALLTVYKEMSERGMTP
jgi:hypothetical protein